jgi:hypothetical protein
MHLVYVNHVKGLKCSFLLGNHFLGLARVNVYGCHIVRVKMSFVLLTDELGCKNHDSPRPRVEVEVGYNLSLRLISNLKFILQPTFYMYHKHESLYIQLTFSQNQFIKNDILSQQN